MHRRALRQNACSYANPDFATAAFGLEFGQLFSAVTGSVRQYITSIRNGNYEDLAAICKLVIDLHSLVSENRFAHAPVLAAYRKYIDQSMESNARFMI